MKQRLTLFFLLFFSSISAQSNLKCNYLFIGIDEFTEAFTIKIKSNIRYDGNKVFGYITLVKDDISTRIIITNTRKAEEYFYGALTDHLYLKFMDGTVYKLQNTKEAYPRPITINDFISSMSGFNISTQYELPDVVLEKLISVPLSKFRIQYDGENFDYTIGNEKSISKICKCFAEGLKQKN